MASAGGSRRQEAPWYLLGRRQVSIVHYDTSDEDRSSTSDTPPARVPRWDANPRPGDNEPEGEFWQIPKLVKYLVIGDQCATLVALTILGDFDFTIKTTQKLLVDNNALEVLVNILETDDLRCKVGVMKIVSQLGQDHHMRNFLIDLGLVPILVCLSNNRSKELQYFTISTLAQFAKVRKARTIIRKCGGVKILLDVVDQLPEPKRKAEKWPPEDDAYKAIVEAMNALWELSKSPKIREILYTSGLLFVIPKLLTAKDTSITLPALGILMLCSTLPLFRDGMERSGLIVFIIKNLSSPLKNRKSIACKATFKCLESEVSREQFYKHGGLDPLVEIVKDDAQWKQYRIIKYCTAALWRVCSHQKSLDYLDGKSLLPTLIRLIQHNEILVATNAGLVLGELTSIPRNCEMLRKLGAMKLLVELIDNYIEEDYLASLAKVVDNCSKCADCAQELTSADALRTMWRLLKCGNPKAKANSAWALVDLIKAVEDAGEEVRSYIGGIARLVDTLEHCEEEVNAAGLAAIAAVAKDPENLEILNEYGVVKRICQLSNTDNDVLREQVGVCVTAFAEDKRNSFKFGEYGVVQKLVGYVSSESVKVKTSAAFALWKLSEEPVNCILLHRNGVVPLMLECATFPEKELQVAAAGVMTNIRGLAHEADQIQALGETITGGRRMHRSFISKTQLLKD